MYAAAVSGITLSGTVLIDRSVYHDNESGRAPLDGWLGRESDTRVYLLSCRLRRHFLVCSPTFDQLHSG